MSPRLRSWIRLTHLWVGLVLSLLLLILALSGSALVYKEAWWRLAYPELRASGPAPTAEEMASALAVASEQFGDELRTVKMPEPGVAAYHLYLEEGEAFLAIDDFRVIDRWTPSQRVMGFLFDLHAHLLAGERGEKVGGVVALLGALLIISGLILWWPARRKTGVRTLVPRRFTRGQLVAAHRDLGLWTAPIVLILLLTGWGIVYYGTAGTLLNRAFGDPPMAAEPLPPESETPTTDPPDAETLEAVQAAFPGARLVFYYPPTSPQEPHRFRLKQGCELHPNGRSYVHADGVGAVVQATDPCRNPPGERALHAVYPLHSGKTPSALYKLATFLGGLALAGLSATGALAYLRKLAPARKRG